MATQRRHNARRDSSSLACHRQRDPCDSSPTFVQPQLQQCCISPACLSLPSRAEPLQVGIRCALAYCLQSAQAGTPKHPTKAALPPACLACWLANSDPNLIPAASEGTHRHSAGRIPCLGSPPRLPSALQSVVISYRVRVGDDPSRCRFQLAKIPPRHCHFSHNNYRPS